MRVLSISLPPGIIVCAYSWRRRSSDQIKQSKNYLSKVVLMFFSASHWKNSIVGKLFKASTHFFPHRMILGRLYLAGGYLAQEKSFVLARWELLKVFRSKSNGHFRENTFLRKSYFFSSSDLAKTADSEICIYVCLYFCNCVFLVFLCLSCAFVFVFEAYLCISSIFRLHLLLALLLSSPAGIYRQTPAQCAETHPLPL